MQQAVFRSSFFDSYQPQLRFPECDRHEVIGHQKPRWVAATTLKPLCGDISARVFNHMPYSWSVLVVSFTVWAWAGDAGFFLAAWVPDPLSVPLCAFSGHALAPA